MKKRNNKCALWTLALLLQCSWLAAFQSQLSCDSLQVKAQRAYSNKDHPLLSSLLIEAEGKACEPGLVYWVGRSLNRQGLRDSARQYFDQVLESSIEIDTPLLGDTRYWLGRSYRSDQIYDESVTALLQSLLVFDSIAYPAKHARSLNALGNVYMEMGDLQKSLIYRQAYVESVESSGNLRRLTIAYVNWATTLSYTDSLKSKTIFLKALSANQELANEDLMAAIHQNLGALYGEKFQKYDSAIYHYRIARDFYEVSGESVLELDVNIAALKEYLGDLKGALSGYLEVLKPIESLDDLAFRQAIYGNLAIVNEKLGNYQEAYEYEKKRSAVNRQLVNEEKNGALAEAEIRYKTAEQERQIFSLEVDNKEAELDRQRAATWAWVAVLGLITVGLVAYIRLKGHRARRLLAEQQSKLDKQRVVELVRQQELIGFDAMVLGQNNERKRLAEALHDHLGSLMATLKLRFESYWLKSNDADKRDHETYNQLVGQIDQACDEIRKVSHDTRSGILISEGLLPAIEELVGNINESDVIHIEVSGYGLNTGLEGTIELAIYRMIQELLTNIIKHAEAKTASVQLTMHESSLNIMVEDAGKGFEAGKEADGVGLKSIRSRVNYLNGDVAIDSHMGRGTTITIEIPLNS